VISEVGPEPGNLARLSLKWPATSPDAGSLGKAACAYVAYVLYRSNPRRVL
jgi:hypothetical protein